MGTSTGGSSLFCFGDTTDRGGAYYVFCNSQAGRVCISTNNAGWEGTGEQNAYSGINWNGRTLHVTCVVNPPIGYISIYTNGVLAGINYAETQPLSGVVNNFSYLNKSVYPGDAAFDATFNEFRIYNGALAPDEIAQTQVLGPDVPLYPVLSATITGGNIVLSWPTTYSGYTLQSKSSLSSGSWSTVGTAPITVPPNYQVTVPLTGSADFFRLIK